MESRKRINSYQDLIVWHKARELVREVYQATRHFPPEELYGLRQQIRRAAVSVPSNIAEGYGRGTRKDYVNFLQMARGSLYEVETQLMLSNDLRYLPEHQVKPLLGLVADCSRLLHGLIRKLKSSLP